MVYLGPRGGASFVLLRRTGLYVGHHAIQVAATTDADVSFALGRDPMPTVSWGLAFRLMPTETREGLSQHRRSERTIFSISLVREERIGPWEPAWFVRISDAIPF